jgi:hypothetical protein
MKCIIDMDYVAHCQTSKQQFQTKYVNSAYMLKIIEENVDLGEQLQPCWFWMQLLLGR